MNVQSEIQHEGQAFWGVGLQCLVEYDCDHSRKSYESPTACLGWDQQSAKSFQGRVVLRSGDTLELAKHLESIRLDMTFGLKSEHSPLRSDFRIRCRGVTVDGVVLFGTINK